MELLIKDSENNSNLFTCLEPNGNIKIQVNLEIIELTPKQWIKIIKFIEREEIERQEEERLKKGWIKRFL